MTTIQGAHKFTINSIAAFVTTVCNHHFDEINWGAHESEHQISPKLYGANPFQISSDGNVTSTEISCPSTRRFVWSITGVENSVFPDADLRNYYDAQDLRALLSSVIKSKLGRACELGCGYGRITQVLGEFSDSTIGLEREPSLVEMANYYLRDIEVKKIEALTDIERHAPFDLVMIFTVLQHCTTEHSRNVMEAMKKSVIPGGYVVIAESTGVDSLEVLGTPSDGNKFISHPRDLNFYKEAMAPATLVGTAKRRLENNVGFDAGTIMIFQQ